MLVLVGVLSALLPHSRPESLTKALDCAAVEKRSTAGEDLLLAPLLLRAAVDFYHHMPTYIRMR